MKAEFYFSRSESDSEKEFRYEIQILMDIYGKENVHVGCGPHGTVKLTLDDFSDFYKKIKEHIYNKIENYNIFPIEYNPHKKIMSKL